MRIHIYIFVYKFYYSALLRLFGDFFADVRFDLFPDVAPKAFPLSSAYGLAICHVYGPLDI